MTSSTALKIADLYRLGLAACVAFTVMLPPMARAVDVGPPVTPKGAGTENRDWVTGPQTPNNSQPIYTVTQQNNVFVTMRDGIRLSTTLYLPGLPANSKTPPCVLVADGYGAALDPALTPFAVELAKRGYPVAFTKLRGTAPSEGTTGLYEKFGQDGYDLVEWAAKQSWCNGDVAMAGASLLGISQWLTGRRHRPI